MSENKNKETLLFECNNQGKDFQVTICRKQLFLNTKNFRVQKSLIFPFRMEFKKRTIEFEVIKTNKYLMTTFI